MSEDLQARCKPGQQSGCSNVEEFFRVYMIVWTLYAMAAQRSAR